MKQNNRLITRILLLFCLFVLLFLARNYWFLRKEITSHQTYNSSKQIVLSGKMSLKLFPGPPEYSSVDNGDREDYCWVLELDQPSFLLALNMPVDELSLSLDDIVRRADAKLVLISSDKKWRNICQQYKNQKVFVRGSLFHAHTAHHYTPMLIEADEIIGCSH